MKYLKPIYTFLNEEALPLNIAKHVVKYGKRERPKGIVDKLNELFDNQQRIYIPIDDSVKGEVEIKVSNFLSSINYSIKDYKLGIAFQTDNPKREIRIGKLLQKEKQLDLLKIFNEDTNRTLAKQQAEYSIVICQHPYDVTAMTTGRSWKSCLEVLAGANRHYIPEEIRGGTITVYYIKTSDRNINDPIGRVNVKLYSEGSGDSYYDAKSEFPDDWVWIPDTGIYGNFPNKALNLLYSWLMSKQSYEFGDVYYKLEGLYNYSGTAYSVKLKTEGEIFKVIELESQPEMDEDDDDFWDDEDHTDWNDRDNWVNELRDIDSFGYYASSYDYEDFEANENGIRTCDVIYKDLVINRDSSSYTDFPDNFQIARLDDTLKIDLSNCVNKYIFDYVKMSSLYECDVTIEGESFNTKCEDVEHLISNLTEDVRYGIIKNLENGINGTLTLVNCDVKSVQSTLDMFFKKYPINISSPFIEINTCLEYLEYLKGKTSIEELEPYEINFLLELDVSQRVSSDMDLDELEIYKLVVDKYSEILKIPYIFKYYNFRHNTLKDLDLINDYFFNQNKSTYLMEFKFKEFFDSLDLITLEINGYDSLEVDLLTLPKSTRLKLSWLDTLEDLTGLRPNVYDNIEIYNCEKFKSPKGLSLKNPNKPNSFKFNILNYPNFTFFDELVEIYPQFLNDVKTLFKENPNGKYNTNIKNWDSDIKSGDYISPTYGNIIKHLEKMSDEDWYKTEGGIKEFLNSVLDRGVRFEINESGEVDVNGSVDIKGKINNVKFNGKIPVKFGKVIGNFNCSFNNLTTLENAPYFVGGRFNCEHNKLTSLEFSPKNSSDFICSNNNLTDLKGLNLDMNEAGINVIFECCDNKITSLVGVPKNLQVLDCTNNHLTNLKGLEVCSLIRGLVVDGNYLNDITNLPKKLRVISMLNQKNGKVFSDEEIKSICDVEYIKPL